MRGSPSAALELPFHVSELIPLDQPLTSQYPTRTDYCVAQLDDESPARTTLFWGEVYCATGKRKGEIIMPAFNCGTVFTLDQISCLNIPQCNPGAFLDLEGAEQMRVVIKLSKVQAVAMLSYLPQPW